jgi:hypothetical protein
MSFFLDGARPVFNPKSKLDAPLSNPGERNQGSEYIRLGDDPDEAAIMVNDRNSDYLIFQKPSLAY